MWCTILCLWATQETQDGMQHLWRHLLSRVDWQASMPCEDRNDQNRSSWFTSFLYRYDRSRWSNRFNYELSSAQFMLYTILFDFASRLSNCGRSNWWRSSWWRSSCRRRIWRRKSWRRRSRRHTHKEDNTKRRLLTLCWIESNKFKSLSTMPSLRQHCCVASGCYVQLPLQTQVYDKTPIERHASPIAMIARSLSAISMHSQLPPTLPLLEIVQEQTLTIQQLTQQ